MADKLILIVEDDRFYRETFAGLLEKSGYVVDIAEDGTQGLELLKENTYDLIISDIMHPNLDGLQMIERYNSLRQEQGPLWYLSNLADHDDVVKQAISLGADRTYSKSQVSPEEVVKKVNEFFSSQTISALDLKQLQEELLGGAEDSLQYCLQFDHVRGLDDQKYLFIITDEEARKRFASAYIDTRADITNNVEEGVSMMALGRYKLVFSDQKLEEVDNFSFLADRDFLSIYESAEYQQHRLGKSEPSQEPDQKEENSSSVGLIGKLFSIFKR